MNISILKILSALLGVAASLFGIYFIAITFFFRSLRGFQNLLPFILMLLVGIIGLLFSFIYLSKNRSSVEKGENSGFKFFLVSAYSIWVISIIILFID